jgi:MFS family permease
MPLRLLIFLTAINLLNYFDRYIVHAVEPLLRADFALTNAQSGFVGAAFVVGYVIFSPLFGYLGDRLDRRLLMALGLLAWSLVTGLTSVASGFYSFVTLRALVGVGEASFSAIVPGYLKGRVSDTIALNSALSIFYVAIPVGSALGYVAGGITAEHWGWRALFGAAAIPGILLALGFWFVPPDKREGDSSAVQQDVTSGVRSILSSRVLRLTILGYIFNTFALNGVAYFVARYGSSLGMEIAKVDWYFGIILVITGILGTLGGGGLASWYAKRSASQLEALLLFVSGTTLLGVPFLCAAFLVGSPQLFFAACFFAELALFAGVAPLNSVIVARAPDGLETLTQGVTIFAIQLFGGALAPIIIGTLADILLSHFAEFAPTSGIALGYALQLSTVAMVFSAVIWFMAALRERSKSAASV